MLGLTKHTQPPTEQMLTRLLVHFNDTSMALTEERGGTYVVETSGQSTTVIDPKFGSRSLLNAGGAGYFTPGPDIVWDFTDINWCLEGWVKTQPDPADAGTLFFGLTDADGILRAGLMSYNYNLYGSVSGGGFTSALWLEFAAPRWQHVAMYRAGDDIFLALDGIVSANLGFGPSPELQFMASRLYLGDGSRYPGVWPNMQGNLDEIRLTIGDSRYGSGNFAPPSLPFGLD